MAISECSGRFRDRERGSSGSGKKIREGLCKYGEGSRSVTPAHSHICGYHILLHFRPLEQSTETYLLQLAHNLVEWTSRRTSVECLNEIQQGVLTCPSHMQTHMQMHRQTPSKCLHSTEKVIYTCVITVAKSKLRRVNIYMVYVYMGYICI